MGQPLSKTSEKRMIDALDQIASLMAEGAEPNDALIKVAGDMKIPSGHLKFMVNAINTGSTNAHRMSSDDPMEKAAEFPLADLDTVVQALYPETYKTKQASFYESVVSSQYNERPCFIEKAAKAETLSRKIDWKLTDKTLTQETDQAHLIKKAFAKTQSLQHELNAKSAELSRIRDTASHSLQALQYYFRNTDHIPYDEVKENATILFGKQASAVLKPITKPKEYNRYYANQPVDVNKAPYTLIKAAIDTAEKFKRLKTDYDNSV